MEIKVHVSVHYFISNTSIIPSLMQFNVCVLVLQDGRTHTYLTLSLAIRCIAMPNCSHRRPSSPCCRTFHVRDDYNILYYSIIHGHLFWLEKVRNTKEMIDDRWSYLIHEINSKNISIFLVQIHEVFFYYLRLHLLF